MAALKKKINLIKHKCSIMWKFKIYITLRIVYWYIYAQSMKQRTETMQIKSVWNLSLQKRFRRVHCLLWKSSIEFARFMRIKPADLLLENGAEQPCAYTLTLTVGRDLPAGGLDVGDNHHTHANNWKNMY